MVRRQKPAFGPASLLCVAAILQPFCRPCFQGHARAESHPALQPGTALLHSHVPGCLTARCHSAPAQHPHLGPVGMDALLQVAIGVDLAPLPLALEVAHQLLPPVGCGGSTGGSTAAVEARAGKAERKRSGLSSTCCCCRPLKVQPSVCELALASGPRQATHPQARHRAARRSGGTSALHQRVVGCRRAWAARATQEPHCHRDHLLQPMHIESVARSNVL